MSDTISFRQKILKETFLYSVANYTTMGVGIFISLFSKRFLGTIGAGYWAILKMVLSYGSLSDLGSREAMLREMAKASGMNNESKVRQSRDAVFAFTLVSSFLVAVLIAAYATFFIADKIFRIGFIIVAATLIVTQIYNFNLMLLRTMKKVPELCKLMLINIALTAALVLFGAYFGGVIGFAAGTLVATALAALAGFYLGAFGARLRWDFAETLRLIHIGLPMIGIGYMVECFLSIDTILIANMIGINAVGIYTIGLMAIQQINALGRYAHIILVPHAMERFGKAGAEGSKSIFMKSTLALAYFTPCVIACAYFLVPVIVQLLIPKFEQGILPMKILVIFYYFIAVNEFSTSALFTMDRQRSLIPAYSFAILVALALNAAAIHAGLGLPGVAAATGLCYMIVSSRTFYLAFRLMLNNGELLRFARQVLFIFFYFVIAVVAADLISRFSANPILRAVIGLAVFFVLFAPLLWRYEQEERVVGMALKMIFGRKPVNAIA